MLIFQICETQKQQHFFHEDEMYYNQPLDLTKIHNQSNDNEEQMMKGHYETKRSSKYKSGNQIDESIIIKKNEISSLNDVSHPLQSLKYNKKNKLKKINKKPPIKTKIVYKEKEVVIEKQEQQIQYTEPEQENLF